MKKMIKLLLLSGLALSAVQAEVGITSKSLQLVLEAEKEVWKPTTSVIPGTVIKYINTVKNDDKQVATDLVVVNNISKHMEYQEGTAACSSNQCDITYAVDLKEGYKTPGELYITDPKTKLRRLAKAKEYTAIRWVIKKLDKNAMVDVEYRSKLK